MNVAWAVTSEKVEAAINRIVEFSRPKKIILFGSYVQRTMCVNSDLDILVVTKDEPENPRKESVRIRRALRGIFMPIDILVVSEDRLNQLGDTPGLIYREALRTGEVVYESA
jgi:predicted nucleotidyltransferase